MKNKEFNIFDEFLRISRSSPDGIALVYSNNSRTYSNITYRDFYEKIIKIGNLLKSVGIEKQDKIAILLDNCPEYAMLFFAIMYANAVIVPIDIQFSYEKIKNILFHCKAKILITNSEIFSQHKKNIAKTDVLLIDSASFIRDLNNEDATDNFQRECIGDSLAALFYTSGTTEEPKGVMLSHRNILSNIIAIKSFGLVNSSDRIVSILPLHHAYAFTVTILLPLLSGATVVFPLGKSSSNLVDCLNEQQITIFVAVPQVFSLIRRSIKNKIDEMRGAEKVFLNVILAISVFVRKITKINLNGIIFSKIHKSFGNYIRFMVSGGARLDSNIAKDFLRWDFTIIEGYGLTETSPVAAFNPINAPKIGSVGKALPGVLIKILSPDEKGIGEVLIKGPNVMLGYYKDEASTKEIIKDGWFYSGDLGFIDKQGYVHLVGRKKNVIVLSSGKNIDPEELEKVYSNSDYIKDICIFSAKKEGFLAGVEHLAAVIVANEEGLNLVEKSNLRNNIKSELNRLSAGLPTYKHISGFVIVRDDFPRTALGKIKRYKVTAIYYDSLNKNKKNMEKQNSNMKNMSGYRDKISISALEILKGIIKQEVNITDHLELDLGLDSLSRIDVLLNLQDRLNLKMTDEQAMDFFVSSTVEELLKKLRKYSSANDIQASEIDNKWESIINKDLSPEMLKAVNIQRGFFRKVLNLIIIILFKIIFKTLFSLKTDGRNDLKEIGPYLICSNHTSYLDGLAIISALPLKIALNAQFVGYSLLFENFILKNLVKMGNIIPIDASVNLIEALRVCSFVLKKSGIVCYFPEGQRSFDGNLNEFKKGVGILIKELNIPVVPVYIDGTFKAWPRLKKFPRLYPIKVKFGKQINLDDLLSNSKECENNYEIISKNLRDSVLSLSKTD